MIVLVPEVGFLRRAARTAAALVIDGAEHSDLTDMTVFKTTVDLYGIAMVGSIGGARSLHIQRSYLTAWIDLALRGLTSDLLHRESPRFPEVDFQP